MASARSKEGRAAMLAHREARALAFGTEAKLRVLRELLEQHAADRLLIFTDDNATVYRVSRTLLIPAITHQTKVKERDETLGRFRSGVYRRVITSRVLNEGIDVPEANVAIVLSGKGTSEWPKGYRFPKTIISYAVYLYHRFLLSYRDVQELLFERGIDVSHETIRAWGAKFGPDLAEALRHRKPRRSRTWHLDEMRVVLGGVTHWLWRAVNEHGDVLDVLLQGNRDTGAAKRFFRRLIDDQELPERIVTDGLRSYGAALRELPELGASEHVTVSAAERQNNLIEQSHRPTRDQERQQRGFRGSKRTQRFLVTHAEVNRLFHCARASTPAQLRRSTLTCGLGLWAELSLAIP